MSIEIKLLDESESIDFARNFACLVEKDDDFNDGLMVYLYGDLGAGKSFFSRAFIQYFIPGQKVKSPTYTIVESYNYSINTIHHLDLYRLCDSEELEYLAIRDLLKKNFVALIEWPQKGAPILPKADVELEFIYQDEGRMAVVKGISEKGKLLEQQIIAAK